MKVNFKKILLFLALLIFISSFSTMGYMIYDYSANNYNEYIINLKAGNIIEEIRIDDINYRLAMYESENLKAIEQDPQNYNFQLEVLNDTSLYYKLSCSETLKVTFVNSEEASFIINGQDHSDLITDNVIDYNPIPYEYILKADRSKMNSVCFVFFIVDAIFLYIIFKFYDYMRTDNKETFLVIIHSIAYAICLFGIMLFSYYVLYDAFKLFVILPIAALIIYNIKFFKGKDYEKLYIICAITFGVLMIFLMPPCNVPDEASHYTKGYELARVYGEEGQGFIQTPVATNEFLNVAANVQSHDNDINARFYFKEVLRNSDYTQFIDGKVNYANVKKAFFIPYIICGLVVKIGTMLSLSPLVIFLITRLANLIFATIIKYFAIKIAPRFKRVLFIIGLLPIVIQQSAAINVDTYTDAVAFLLIAYILKLIYEIKEIGVMQVLLLFGAGLLLCFGKFGYFPVALMLILVPNAKFKSKSKGIVLKVAFFVFMLIISYFFNTINNYIITDVVNDETNVYGLKYILTNPFSAIAVYFRSFLIRLDQDIFRGYFNCFGYSTVVLKTIPYLVTFAMYIIILCTKEADDEEQKLTLFEKIVYVLIFVMLIGIIYTVAFSAWTKMGARSILGVQSRYFIPLLPLLYFVIQDIGLKINVPEKIKNKLGNRDLSFVLISITYIIAFATIISFFA